MTEPDKTADQNISTDKDRSSNEDTDGPASAASSLHAANDYAKQVAELRTSLLLPR